MPILPGTDGEREDVEVATATTSASPSRPRRCTARRCASPTRRCGQWYELLLGARAAGRRRPARRQARARAGARGALPRRRGGRGGRGSASTACTSSTGRPRRCRRSTLAADGDGARAPAGAARRRVRRLALGGAARARAGRREARRRAARGASARRRRVRALDGAVLQLGKRQLPARCVQRLTGASARRAADPSCEARRSGRPRQRPARRAAPGYGSRASAACAQSAILRRPPESAALGRAQTEESPSREGATVFENSTACAPSVDRPADGVRPGSTAAARRASGAGQR